MGAGGIVAVGLGQEAEAPVAAHDGDGRVGPAAEITRQVAHVGPAAVFVSEAARQPQRAPVRRAIACAGKAQDIHEGLR